MLGKILGNSAVVTNEKLNKEFKHLLIENETVEKGYQLVRDVFIFTNKRLILVDKQGITGKKIEYLSLPYKSISRFSIETSGHFDLDAELKIYLSSAQMPTVSKKFNKKVNVYDLQKILAKHVMG